ncbi:hypothetical protein V6C20_09250 [Caldibacillus thermoamylovorans]
MNLNFYKLRTYKETKEILLGGNDAISIKKMSNSHLNEFNIEVNALMELQGCQAVPKLYAYNYSEKEIYTERIIGENIFNYCRNNNKNVDSFKEEVRSALYEMVDRGWLYTNLRSKNIIVSSNDSKIKILDYSQCVRILRKDIESSKTVSKKYVDDEIKKFVCLFSFKIPLSIY